MKLHILCNIKAVSFTYPLENFTLDWFFYTTSGCDGCDKYEVCLLGHWQSVSPTNFEQDRSGSQHWSQTSDSKYFFLELSLLWIVTIFQVDQRELHQEWERGDERGGGGGGEDGCHTTIYNPQWESHVNSFSLLGCWSVKKIYKKKLFLKSLVSNLTGSHQCLVLSQ